MELQLHFKQILQLIRQLPMDQKKKLQSFLTEDLSQQHNGNKKRQIGGLKGFVTYIAEDFDAPIEDMKPYME
ncbi:MAG: DUF2281 domain-containing protein [Bacteroidota bacterium]